ncbi:MAG TPA: M24 family metallopeptidase [Acidimicrobiia bacterium]|nr:M24 family metallopeptidase [Acidimicrobiia bacterium]
MSDLRREAAQHDALLRRRLDTLVPALLDESGIDCWLLIGREYAEDPVLATMLPAEWLSARRRTILVLTRTDRFAVARYPVGELFRGVWDPDANPDQWACLAELLSDLDPASVGVGVSPVQAHADGLTKSEYDHLIDALPPDFSSRVVSAGHLGVRWLETRLPEERDTFAEATRIAHGILRRGLSTEAVTPGATSTTDLAWWYRQTVHDAGLGSWFHPTVEIQRTGPNDGVIRQGDLVHVDFGIVHRGLCTDQQEHAYVLHDGEDGPPAGLTKGLERANLIQDILLDAFVEGRTGDEILRTALARARSQGLKPTIYTHGIGLHGHGAGTTIGLWDHQEGVPGAGSHPLYANTAHSIELMGESQVPEWGSAPTRFMLEQDAWFDGDSCTWLDGRQEELWLI